MAQWGQPGYQYPMQTGFNPQQFQQGFQPSGGIAPQPTGFPGQRPVGFQQPQPTGYPGTPGFQQPQQTGFPGPQGPLLPQQTGFPGASNFHQRAPPPPPVPPIPPQFQNASQTSGFMGLQSQPTGRFPAVSPLQAQPTGYPGAGGGLRPLVPQVTGFVDPRLAMMSNTFMPVNPSMPYNPAGAPQLPSSQLGGLSLQQNFQQHNQMQRGNATPKVPWTLSKAEKKQYDQIFRAWDVQGTGFVSGETALEVFGQSGIDRNDLAKIWALADVDNRGKLNLAEFHVAMGLIYRRLNGNDIPDELPQEMVPPSHRDLDASVTLLKDILKNDTRSHSPSSIDVPVSRLKERSFNNTGVAGAGGRQDATVYKYNEESPPGGFYQPRSRHVDRSAVRTTSDLDNPASDLNEMKRQLENTAKMLDRAAEENASRTAEDEALDREMDDLRYRVNRVKDDLDYVSLGPRSQAKDEERRRLERELLKLMHERIPEVERKIKDRDERRAREKRERARERDRRNERFGRYDDRDDRYSSRYDDDRDRPYSRNRDYDRDRDNDRDRPYSRNRDRDYDRDRDYERDRERDRDYGRPKSPVTARSPPPAPPPAPPPSAIAKPPPPAPTPSKSPAPNYKSMTPEERKAYIQGEAQRRMQERMAALGVSPAGSASPKLDTSVEDRLALEKKEAEEKARAAEKQAEERERVRRERLENEKALKGSASPAPPTPGASAPAPPPTAQTPTPKPTPPPAKPRAPAPPPPRKAPAPKPPASRAPPAPAPPAAPPAPPAPAPPAPAAPEEDPEEAQIRAREAALRKQRERLERLRQLEREEEDARRAEEEYQARRRAFEAKAAPAPAALTPPVPPPAPAAAPAARAPAVASPPPAPPAPAATPSADRSFTNPFSRIMKDSPSAGAATTPTTSSANGSTNPFFKSQAASPPAETALAASPPPAPRAPSVPPPSKSPAPPAVKTSYHTAPAEDDEDWDEIQEKDDGDSSDDDIDSSRDTRNKLAQQLFGSILPPSRPQSAAATVSSPKTAAPPQVSSPTQPSPPPPSAPPVPVMDGVPAPPPPMAPGAPPPPAVTAPAPTGDRGALLSAIQSGARLKKAQTNDRSASQLTGKVLGSAEPPAHVNAAPRPLSPPSVPESPEAASSPSRYDSSKAYPEMPPLSTRSSHRESVGWYAGLAADAGLDPMPDMSRLPSMAEVEEPATSVPAIQVDVAENDLMSDVDKSIAYRVRSLYPFEGQRPEDLSFAENLILTAHPFKTGGDWWYGTLLRDGKAGFFPRTYVEKIEQAKARALYSYEGTTPDELPFSEGDELSIVDRSDADWWKAERDGVVFIVPAGYLEIVEAPNFVPTSVTSPEKPLPLPPANDQDVTTHVSQGGPINEPACAVDTSDDEEDDISETDSVYLSFSESDADDTDEKLTEEARAAERHARKLERQRVLEAAGFIIKEDVKPPPRPARPRKDRKRRPPPAVPDRVSTGIHSRDTSADLDVPESADNSLRLDDAFERYEAFRHANPNMNRLSVASMESCTSGAPPSPASPSLIGRSTSTEAEARGPLHFLSIFGRKTPGNDGEARTIPTISAPIMREPSSPGAETEGDFGLTWASLVDKSALEEMPAKERRRQEAIFELIVTEAAYVRDVQLVVEHFYANLLSVLEEKAVKVIFANIEDILLVNTTFLSILEQRQKDCRLYIDQIGDILRQNMSEMGVYVEYCVNQAYAAKVLQSERKSKPELAQLLQRLRDDPTARNLDLSSYLLVPMQRMTRYPLLIRQVLHYTEMANDRRRIEQALEVSERILAHINETIRHQEGQERLRAISKDLWIGQGRLDLTAPTRRMGPRRLLKEGALVKAKSGRKLRAFLCSDILVLTQEPAKQLYRTPIPLSEIQVREVSGRRDDLSFQIAIAYPRGGDAISLRASSARDCQVWMQAIEKASAVCRDVERRTLAR